MDIRVISIGALAAHPLWEEKSAVRTGHATCTLIRSGKLCILVDPGLPPSAIVPRLKERSGLDPGDITHLFFTSFKPDTTRGAQAFPEATWWVSHGEREGVGVALVAAFQRATEDGELELARALEQDVRVLRRSEVAPDKLAPKVDLFPLPGVTPGCTGLLLATAQSTILVAGDAVATIEHLERGMVLPSAANVVMARESFAEAVEIADQIVLGRDNMVNNPIKRPIRGM